MRPSLTQLPNGRPVDLVVRAYDAAGNVGEAKTSVLVDSVAPTATLVPKWGTVVPVGDLTVALTGVSSDTDHIAILDGVSGSEISRLTSAPWTFVWPATVGGVPPFYRLTDRAGNVSWTHNTSYVVDDNAPVIGDLFASVDGETLQVGSRVGKGAGLWPTITDETYAGRFAWTVDGVPAGSTQYLEWTFPARSEPYRVTLKAWDMVGNLGERSWTLVSDTSGPTALSVLPANGTLVRGSRIAGTLRAEDPSGIWKAQLSGAAADTSAPFAATVAAGRDGARTLTWTVRDGVGNPTNLSAERHRRQHRARDQGGQGAEEQGKGQGHGQGHCDGERPERGRPGPADDQRQGGRDRLQGRLRLLDQHQEVRQEDQGPASGVRPGREFPGDYGPHLVPLGVLQRSGERGRPSQWQLL